MAIRLPVLGTFFVLLVLGGAPARAADDAEWEVHIAGLERRIQFERSNPNHYLRVAQAYSMRGDTQQVLDYARMAEQRGAHPARVHLLIGDHYLRLHRFERALRNFDQATRTAPNIAYGWVRVWRTLYELQRAGQRTAIDVPGMASALEVHGFYFPVAWRGRGAPATDRRVAARLTSVGYRLLSSNDLPGAVRSFRRALDSDPTHADAYRGLGITHARQRRIELAFGAYTLFMELAPSDHPDAPGIRKIITDFYRARGRGR